jgi:PAS domain S-box-containing protein
VDLRADPPLPDEFRQLGLLIQHSTDMLARHAPDGSYRYVSPACRELLGYEPSELAGRSPYELIHRNDLAAVSGCHAALLDESRLRAIVYRIRRADGEYVWFETTGHALHDGEGEISEIQTSSRDVTSRVRAEARLRESEQRFRLAMTNAPIGMALVGLDGSFVEVNERLCEILARPRDELLTLTFQDITHREDLDTDLGYVGQLLTDEIEHYEMEKRYHRPSGEVVWALLSGSLVRDDEHAPLYFIAQVVDITERKRVLLELEHTGQQLEASNRELQRYASVAAHDLRSPLATVSGFLELLSHRLEGQLDAQGAQILQVTRQVTMQMAETVEALLDLTRVDIDELTPTTVDVGEVVTEVVDASGSAFIGTDAWLDVDTLPSVRGDRAQLRLLFQNLLLNAIKFRSPDRPLRITIRAEPEPTGWRFAVLDNGLGLDEADQERLFEPFSRTSEGHHRGSTGIGLATCKRIVERHGGTIRAYDAHPGACLEFTLPAAPEGPDAR